MLYKYLKYLLIVQIGYTLAISGAYCQDKNIPSAFYDASTIPDSLKEDANSVIRYSSDEVTLNGPGKAVIKHHSLVTILNEHGDKEAFVIYGYNRKYDTYSSINIRIYDQAGKIVKKYSKSDMYDAALSSDETLVSDDRFLALKHTISSYPSSIEISYEEDLDSFISLDDWTIQKQVEQSVQSADYTVLTNPDISFIYKNKNISISPIISTQHNLNAYVWHVQNIKAIKKEDNILSWQILPHVMFGTNTFNCYGYLGDISTWQNFGKWIQSLNNDMAILNPQRIQEIKKMTDTIKTPREKVRFLYNYMQKNMRYVSIQLGIGGYKPFAATFVDQKKYGDCKALANYMRALLKAVDIESDYAIIRAGINEEPADPLFPHNAFNHAILCVPLKGDTTWLECTSTTQPFGTLGPFTENRNALLITNEGGKLVNTPKSTLHDNQFNSEVHIALDADGSAKAEMKILSTGEFRQLYIALAEFKTDKQKEFLIKSLNIKQPSLFEFKDAPDKDGIKQFSASLEYDKFCDVLSGDKRFYRPQVFDLWGMTVPILEKRKTDFYFDHPFQKTCTTTINLPEGFEVETMPTNTSLKFTYGNYEISYIYNKENNQVISTAKVILNNQVIPAVKYAEMQQYMDGIAKAQNKKLVIRKKA